MNTIDNLMFDLIMGKYGRETITCNIDGEYFCEEVYSGKERGKDLYRWTSLCVENKSTDI